MAEVKKKPLIGLQPEGDVDWSQYRGVLVVVEQRDGQAKPVSWQLLGEGRRLADAMGAPLLALVIGHKIEHLSKLAIGYGADTVYVCDAPELAHYRTRPFSRICLQVIRQYKPEIVLFGATYTGRDLAGAIATHLPTGLTADCTQLEVDEERILHASRPAFSEKMIATILCKQFKPQMATVRPGVFQASEFDGNRIESITEVSPVVDVDIIMTEVLEFIESQDGVHLEDADIIVAGGRGLGGPEGVELLRRFADAIGGTVAATRPVCEQGWIGHEYQVGQTGSTVRPKLYFAIGISGAVQHVVGMQNSDCIIAINKDQDAPIFNIASYGIVGDLFEIVPALIEAWNDSKVHATA
jgi:electron transfer flavoprotein alpha subunit